MLKEEAGESVILAIWVYLAFVCLALGTIMRNSGDGQQQKNSLGRANNGFLPSSFRAISSYWRIVSSGASTVARSAASVAQSFVDRDDDVNPDQVLWVGFDKLEGEDNVSRQVLLLGYRSGFQVWDVEEAENVRDLVSRHDGPVSFLQMLPKPLSSKRLEDKFADSRPLLVVCSGGTLSGGSNVHDGSATGGNGSIPNYHDFGNGIFVPTVVQFYSLRSQSYIHELKFRSAVYSVRCSSRIVVISQNAQIHCFDATTLEREYIIVTNPIHMGSPGFGSIGHGPLAVGPRWLAYSGSPVVVSNSGRVSPQHLAPTVNYPVFTSNGSLVAHYAKESSKQLAAGIVSLGDMGYKKLSRYCSELLPDSHSSLQSAIPGWKGNGTVNGHLLEADNIGMVVVKDIVSKLVITQFRAHKSPISALQFDPSGMLLVTASVQGHNINVFKIMAGVPGSSSAGDAGASSTHLYRLQRGFTNAVIQDISFSDDSNWIMISSSRGTSHLFAINPYGGTVNFQSCDTTYTTKNNGLIATPKSVVPPSLVSQNHNQLSLNATGFPITLSAVSRIRNGSNGWRETVTGAAAAATGRLGFPLGPIASCFHNCKGNHALDMDGTSFNAKYHLVVFSPVGCMIQYVLQMSVGDVATTMPGLSADFESAAESEARIVVEAIQQWNICQKHNRREREDNVDIYGENGNSDGSKIYPEGMKRANSFHPKGRGALACAKISPDEKHHVYISEAELQMHQARPPIWAKPEIYFQSMMTEGIKIEGENMKYGEIEIEKIPSRTIEARSKDLVPVFNHLETPKFQHARVSAIGSDINGALQHRRSGLSDSGRLSQRSSSGPMDSITDNGAVVAESNTGFEEPGWPGPSMPVETRDFVNSNDSSKTNTRPETVNNRESLRMEAQFKIVNNNDEGVKMENHFDDEGDEFD